MNTWEDLKWIIRTANTNEYLNSKPWQKLTIHESFSRAVERYRDKIAIIHDDMELSYWRIDELSDHLASFLNNNWVEPGSKVGVYFNKWYLYLVSCLAILKCGASYIHIDSTYWDDIIKRIIYENSPKAILTLESLLDMATIDDIPLYKLDSLNEWYETPLVDLDVLKKDIKVSNTAIIGYTSGTTWNPKWVDVSHEAAIYSFSKFWQEINDIPDNKKDRFAYVTYLAWDALSPLLFWASGVIIPDESTENIDLLFHELHKNKINHIFLTPTLLKKILDFVSNINHQDGIYNDVINNIWVVWIWGETIDPATVEKFMEIFINSALINNYGPTECWVVSQWRLVKSKIKEYFENWVPNWNILPEIYYKILNENWEEVTIWEIWFLYVSWPSLANWYIKRPDLVAEKFIMLGDGKIYFKTWDLCKILIDWGLQIIGREDFITSNDRILPIEKVQTNIREIPWIKDCVVISGQKSTNKKDLLIFYLVLDNYDKNELKMNVDTTASKFWLSFISIHIDEIPMNETSQKLNYLHLLTLANKISILEIL